MRKFSFIIFLLLFSVIIYAEESELLQGLQTDFRNVTWGMSKEEVKKKEANKLIEEGKDILRYEGTIAGLNCEISYYFFKNKLWTGIYHITTKYLNINKAELKGFDIALDFIKLRRLLKKKYGSSSNDSRIWEKEESNDFECKENTNKWTEWKTNTTIITLILDGYKEVKGEKEYISKDNYIIESHLMANLKIIYESKELKPFVEKAKKIEKENLEDF